MVRRRACEGAEVDVLDGTLEKTRVWPSVYRYRIGERSFRVRRAGWEMATQGAPYRIHFVGDDLLSIEPATLSMRKMPGYHSTMDWSVLTDPDANLGDDARAELARLGQEIRARLSQTLGTYVTKRGEEMIRPWFSRGTDAWGDVDVYGAEMRDGALVLHFIADHYNYNVAQSGSDWADHYVFVGEAHHAGGTLDLDTLALERQVQVSEHESEGYDRRKILDTARAELRAKLRGAAPNKAVVEKAVDDDTPASSGARAAEARPKTAAKGAAANANVIPEFPREWYELMFEGAKCRGQAKAVEHYEAAAKLAERFGPLSVYLGNALLELALARHRVAGGDVDASLYMRALAILEKNLDNLTAINSLPALMDVWCSQEEKDYAEAERLGKHFLPLFERIHGIHHEGTTRLVLKLGHALGLQHKHAEVDQLYERWLQATDAAQSDGFHIHRVIRVITDMARNFRAVGSNSKAESMYSRALTLSEKLPGDPPREVLLELGTLCGEQGRYEEAEKLLRSCWSKAYPSDTEVAEALGNVLRRTGREKDAEDIEAFARRHHWYVNP